jgi:hypothetical protein
LAAFVEAEKPVTGITKLFSKLQSRSTVTNWSFTIFDDIISPAYIDHGQSAYMGSPGRGIAGAKNDLKISLDKLDDFHYTVEAMIASAGWHVVDGWPLRLQEQREKYNFG